MAASSASFPLFLTLSLLFARFSSSDFSQDKGECADKLVNLATCLPYVSGGAKAPTLDCCSGFKKVVDGSKRCLCVLLKDRDDPNLGFKFNSSLALALPSSCHFSTNITECIDLLHLPANSKDAKIFEGSVNSTRGNNSTAGNGTPTGKETSSEVKNDGGRRQMVEMEVILVGLLIWVLTLSPV